MRPAVIRAAGLLLAALLSAVVAACAPPPRAFERDDSEYVARPPRRDKVELAIGAPRNMSPGMAQRVAAGLAIELQAYGIVAAVQPAEAPIQVSGTMITRDAEGGNGIEIQIDWRIEGAPKTQEPAVSRTRARPEDFAEESERLVSRIAQQAAPRIATLIGRPPTFQARGLGQVAAGITVPEESPVDPVTATAMAAASSGTTPAKPAANQPQEPQVKVMVAPVTGAPSDGNKPLYSGMRRALGSNKIVIVDAPGNDVFSVQGNVTLTKIDENRGQLVIKWVLKDPEGRTVGDLEQSNPVPLAATKGSWAGFGDIVATAASEGVLELLQKALMRGRP
jgi:hypothetical protein